MPSDCPPSSVASAYTGRSAGPSTVTSSSSFSTVSAVTSSVTIKTPKFCQNVMLRVSNDLGNTSSAEKLVQAMALDCKDLQRFVEMRAGVTPTLHKRCLTIAHPLPPTCTAGTNLQAFYTRVCEFATALRLALAAACAYYQQSIKAKVLAGLGRDPAKLRPALEQYSQTRVSMFVCCGMSGILDAQDGDGYFCSIASIVEDLTTQVCALQRILQVKDRDKQVAAALLQLQSAKLRDQPVDAAMGELADRFRKSDSPKPDFWSEDVIHLLVSLFQHDAHDKGRAASVADIMVKLCSLCNTALSGKHLVAVAGSGFHSLSCWPQELTCDGVGRLVPPAAESSEWHGTAQLTELHLTHSASLRNLPHQLSLASNLQLLSLEGCAQLRGLPTTLGTLTKLQQLNCSGCSSMAALPDTLDQLTSLQELHLQNCSSLAKLPDSLGGLSSLTRLNAAGCRKLALLPPSIGSLASLQVLDCSNCTALFQLPQEMVRLSGLKQLNLDGCERLMFVPEALVSGSGGLSRGVRQVVEAAAVAAKWNYKATVAREFLHF